MTRSKHNLNSDEEEEEHTHRALAQPFCRSESLQHEGLITAKRLDRFCWLLDHWGLKQGNTALTPLRRDTAKRWLEGIVYPGKSFDFETQEDALENMLSTAEATVYDPPSDKDRIGPKACKNFCEATFRRKLLEADKVRRALRNAEHADQVQAEKVQAVATIDVETQRDIGAEKRSRERAFTEKKAALLDERAAERNAESTSRPRKEASPRANGRFDDDDPKVDVVRGVWITGWHANQVLDGVEGATVAIVKQALFDAGPEIGSGFKPSPPDVVNIAKRLVLFALHGLPESRCGGEVAQFKAAPTPWDHGASSRWVCLSAAFCDGVEKQFELEKSQLEGIFRELTRELNKRDILPVAEYLALQSDFETKFKAKAEEIRAAAIAREKAIEERLAGFQNSDGLEPGEEGGFGIIRKLIGKRSPCVSLSQTRVNRLLTADDPGAQKKRRNAFGEAWKLVNTRIYDWVNERIEPGIVKLAQLINADEEPLAAARSAFPDAFAEAFSEAAA